MSRRHEEQPPKKASRESTPPTDSCPFCGSNKPHDAPLCVRCSNYRSPHWLVRLRASWVFTLVRLVAVAAIAWTANDLYHTTAESTHAKGERARRIAETAMEVQVIADELRSPCRLDATGCGARAQELIRTFHESAYQFKEQSNALFGLSQPDAPISLTMAFLDEFFNPSVRLSEDVDVLPLQEALVRATRFLARPFTRQTWCSLEGRAAVRSLMLSIDVYRYCYTAVRSYATKYGQHPFVLGHAPLAQRLRVLSKRTDDRLTNCSVGQDYGDNTESDARALSVAAKRVLGVVRKLEAQYSAPWLYDGACETTISGPVIASSVRQLVVVTSDDWDASGGFMTRFERRPNGPWIVAGGPVPVALGSAGLAWGRGLHPDALTAHAERLGKAKTEGDLRAPAGAFSLGNVFGATARTSTRMPYVRTTPSMLCEDRPDSQRYNQWFEDAREATRCGQKPDGKTRGCPESLRRSDGMYDTFVWVNHNSGIPGAVGATPGAGSCIFLHAWDDSSHRTTGCTAMAPSALRALVEWLDPAASPVLVQLPRPEYEAARSTWDLPDLVSAATAQADPDGAPRFRDREADGRPRPESSPLR